jgi:hypothetical protein
MVAAVKQIVTIKPGGVISLRSKELRAGEQAEVTVRYLEKPNRANGHKPKSGTAKKSRVRKERAHRMSKQDHGDVAWAKKIMADPKEKPVSYALVRKQLGLA